MKKVLIVDAYTPAHVGNGVLLKSSIEVIKRAMPDADISFLSLETSTPKLISDLPYDSFLFKFPVHLSTLRKICWLITNSIFMMIHILNIKTIKLNPSILCCSKYRKTAFDRIQEADIVISITGEAINDRTRATLPFFLFTYWMAAALGKKMVIFPQSIGPLNRKWTRKLCNIVLNRCALVVGRDDYSIEELKGLGVDDNKTFFSPDVGVIQPFIDEKQAAEILNKQSINPKGKTLIGISVSKPKEDGIANIDHISIMLESIINTYDQENVKFLILPANMPLTGVDEGDLADCIEFSEKLSKFDVSIMEPRIYSPEEYKGVLSLLDLFVSSRMHVSILATMAATPTVTINTQRKLYGYMTNIGLQEYSLNLDTLTNEQLSQCMKRALKNKSDIKNHLLHQRKNMNHKINDFCDHFANQMTL